MALITFKTIIATVYLPYWKFTMKPAKHTKAIKVRLTEQEYQTLKNKKQENRTTLYAIRLDYRKYRWDNYDHSTKSIKIEA